MLTQSSVQIKWGSGVGDKQNVTLRYNRILFSYKKEVNYLGPVQVPIVPATLKAEAGEFEV